MLPLAVNVDRPDRVRTNNKDNDPDYHRRMGRHTLYQSSFSSHSNWYDRIKVNKAFYIGQDNQWMFDEDIEAFLKDDTNQRRNRIKVVNNIIRPMVEQYRGNANRMSINASAQSISSRSKTRRDTALDEQLLNFDIAMDVPEFADLLKETFGLSDTKNDTISRFSNLYVDEFAESITKLIQYVKDLNQMQEMQIRIAENLALTGLGVLEGFEQGGHYRFDVVESDEFFFDTSARRPDLSDAEFMGRYYMMLPTDIYERYDVSPQIAEEIEQFVRINSGLTGNLYDTNNLKTTHAYNQQRFNRVPVYRVFWRDTDYSEWGYVESEFGYQKLVRINYVEEGEEEPRYTDADLVEPPQSKKNDKIFKGKKKAKRYTDVVRYAVFIPSEVLAAPKEREEDKRKTADVLLDWGLYDHQESDLMDSNNVKFPFKAYCWAYIDGTVVAPVDDAISPQRLINRVMSVTEQNINNSGGSNVVIDEDKVNPDEIADGTVARNIKQGKPIFVRSRGVGVQNVVTTYDNTPKAGTYAMFDIIPILKQFTQETTGINEPLQGQSTGSDQLVGVTEILLERGSLMQEPFYHAVSNIFLQAYQSVATIGRNIYVDNQRELAISVGDQSADVINLSAEMKLEDFRVFIKRTNNEDTLKKQADQLLLGLAEMQFIDQNTFAKLYGNSTPEQVTKALRQEAVLRTEVAKQEAQAQTQLAQQQEAAQIEAGQAQLDEARRLEAREDRHRSEDAAIKAQEQTRQNQSDLIKEAQKQANNF